MSESNLPDLPQATAANAFETAAVTALQELAQLEAFPIAPPEAIRELAAETVVFATISLRRALPGTMTLVMAASAAAQLARRYLPEGTSLTPELIDDVVGEFANVMAGQAKTILKGTPYHFTLSTPEVHHAPSAAELPAAAPPHAIALACELGPVLVLIDLPACASV